MCHELNALVLGLFIISTIAMTVTRQIGACMLIFIIQSLLLAASAFLLGAARSLGTSLPSDA